MKRASIICALGFCVLLAAADEAVTVDFALDAPRDPQKYMHAFANCQRPQVLRLDDQGKIALTIGSIELALQVKDGSLTCTVGDDVKPIAKNQPIEIAFTFAGKKGVYRLQQRSLRGMVIAYPITTVSAIHAGRTITILDANANGSFTDVGEDLVVVAAGSMKPATSCLLQDMLLIGDALVSIKPDAAKEGAFVFTPYAGPVAKVKLATGPQNRVTLAHAEGKLTATLVGNQGTTLVPGVYQLLQPTCMMTDPQNAAQRAALYGERGVTPTVSLVEGDNELKLGGPPFALDFDAKVEGDTITMKRTSLVGAGGEMYRAYMRSSTNQRTSMTWSVKVGDQSLDGGKLDYG